MLSSRSLQRPGSGPQTVVPQDTQINLLYGLATPDSSRSPDAATLAPPLSAQQQAQLSPDAAAYYHLLEGNEPGRVNRNLAALSPPMKALLTQLSPLSVLGQIRARIHLLHDRTDPSIPFTQAQEFAVALTRLHHPYDFAAYSIFSHVQVQSNLDLEQVLGDGSKLLGVLTSMLLVGS